MVLSMSNHLMQVSFNTLASLLPTYKALTMVQKNTIFVAGER